MGPTWRKQPTQYWVGIGVVLFIIIIIVLSGSRLTSNSRGKSLLSSSGSSGHSDLNRAISNSTLGFQRIYAINLPERSDHRDALALAGAVTGLNITFVNGVHGEAVPDKALPPGRENEPASMTSRGSWRAHINAIRTIVEEGLESALIFEDDVDWDVRIKSQLRDYSKAAQALLQPLKSDPGRYADPTFPVVEDASLQPDAMSMDNLPSTVPAERSPYGDNWDVLWLGHCGVHLPQVGLPEDLAQVAVNIPKGRVAFSGDDTVPEPRYISVYDTSVHQELQRGFPPHTRVTHHTLENICSLAYAVSQRGARSLLYELGLNKFDDNFDIELREYCDGTQGREKHVCLTVSPTFFDHHRPVGQISHDSDLSDAGGGERQHAYTNNIRFSTRLNMEKLLKGQIDFTDQFPDTQRV